MRACATMASISPSRRLRFLSRSCGGQQRTRSPTGKPGQARRRPQSSNGRDSNEGAATESAINVPPVSRPTALVLDRNRDFALDGAVEGVDQRLDLDELVARSLGRVAHKRSGQHFRMRVPVLDHAITGLLQSFKSLAHPASPEKLSRSLVRIRRSTRTRRTSNPQQPRQMFFSFAAVLASSATNGSL